MAPVAPLATPLVRSVSHWIHSCHNRLNTDAEEDKRKCQTYENSGILTEEGHVNVNSTFIHRSEYANIILALNLTD